MRDRIEEESLRTRSQQDELSSQKPESTERNSLMELEDRIQAKKDKV